LISNSEKDTLNPNRNEYCRYPRAEPVTISINHSTIPLKNGIQNITKKQDLTLFPVIFLYPPYPGYRLPPVWYYAWKVIAKSRKYQVRQVKNPSFSPFSKGRWLPGSIINKHREGFFVSLIDLPGGLRCASSTLPGLA
jgi:hypothetical protein